MGGSCETLPTQLAFLLYIVCRIFLSSSNLCNTFPFSVLGPYFPTNFHVMPYDFCIVWPALLYSRSKLLRTVWHSCIVFRMLGYKYWSSDSLSWLAVVSCGFSQNFQTNTRTVPYIIRPILLLHRLSKLLSGYHPVTQFYLGAKTDSADKRKKNK